MSTFEIGTGYKQPDFCTALIKCGSKVGVECTEFIDSGAGITVYHLYNVSGCDFISKSSLVIDIRYKGTTEWEPWATYNMGGYEGFTYYWVKIDGGIDWEFRATYKGNTKYYSIVSPCVPDWQCRQPLDGYETDINNCGDPDRYNEDCVNQCEGVVCDNICDGFDLWSQKCDPATGTCVNDQLLETNSGLCGYDSCVGVVCDTICDGFDLWSQKCDPATGTCVNDQLLESNTGLCGYDPCGGVVCDNICDGYDLWSQKCDPATGTCVNDQLLETNSVECGYGPHEGVVEDNIKNLLIFGGVGAVALGIFLVVAKSK